MARSEIVIPVNNFSKTHRDSYRMEARKHIQEAIERCRRPEHDLRRELSSMFSRFPMRSSIFDDDFDDFFKDIVPAPSFPSFEKVFKEVKTVIDENNKMLMEVDVSEYEPEEITVKAIEGKLIVHCKKQRPGSTKESRREFSLPEGVDVETITSNLTADGMLKICALLPVPGQTMAFAEPCDQKSEAFLYVDKY